METTGTLKYQDQNRLWVLIDYEVGAYLRKLFWLERYVKLGRPSRTEHISVVSHYERILNPDFWNKYENKPVYVNIELETYTNGNAWWCRIYSNELNYVREELGLENPKKVPLHLGFGYERINSGTTTPK